jgi:hypothetical protein
MDQRKTIAWALVTCSAILVLLTAMLPTASGQSTTGRISGTVLDPQSAVVPEATVTLTNTLTGQTREVTAGSQGEFVFTQLFAGTYEVSVTAPGFKVYQQKDIKLSANEAVALRNVQLEIGTTAETVEVTAAAARVETQSSERTALISTTQVSELSISPDRSYIKMLRLLPGVLVQDMQGADLYPIGGQMQINGGKSGQAMVTLDGITDTSTESTWSGQGMINPNIEAISEVKVMLTNYTAEYGIRSGGTINVSIKNGTKEFHGGGYYFKRHENLNAHNWQKDPPISAKPRYRYDNFGATLGGPVIFPGTSFNKDRDRLFFFVSLDWLKNITPSGPLYLRFPTELERNGDFSKTETLPGVTKKITDGQNGPQFACEKNGTVVLNCIPAARIDPVGQGMMNWYPQPTQGVTWVGQAQYNYYDPEGYVTESPKNQQIIRMDWNVAPKTLIYGRFFRKSNPIENPAGNDSISMSRYPVLGSLYNPKAIGWGATWVQTFSTNLVNEATVGFNKGITEQTPYEEDLPNVTRSNLDGIQDFQQFHPEINTQYNIMPMWGFSGGGGPPPPPPGGGGGAAGPSSTGDAVIAAPSISGSAARFMHYGDNTLWNIIDNLSWVKGRHSLKFGFYAEIASRNSNRESDFTGTFNFASDVSNPFNTGLGMANMIIGSVTKYTESDKAQYSQARYKDIEFYVQDSWRATRRLTLDIGIRFQNIAPTTLKDGSMAMFQLERYDPDTAMKYYIPWGFMGSQSYNPITGEVLNSRVYQGSFALPANITDPMQMFPAVGIFEGRYLNNPGMLYSPRFGFAYDVLGNGKMAIRGGFGMFYERSGGDETQANYMQVPPLQNIMSIYYTPISQIQGASTLKLYGPGTSMYAQRGGQRDFSAPGSYNWSLGVQRDMGLGLVLDVSYVGTVGRHQRRAKSINGLHYGTHFQDWALNTNAPMPGPPGSYAVYPDYLLRHYQGYDVVSYFQFDGTSNYHSMQMTLNRRFGTRFTVGGNWVWSKVMDYATQYEAGFPNGHPDFLPDSLYYGKADTDRTHNVMVNFTYRVPGLSSHMGNNIIAKGVFDGWVIAGIASFVTGSPATTGGGGPGGGTAYSISIPGPPVDITGADGGEAGVPMRVSISGNPLRSDQAGLQSQLNPAAIVVPKYGKGVCQYDDPYTCGLGNAPRYIFTGPGTNNWDMTFYKSFQLGSNEARSLEVRCETYNTFNHTQYSGVDTSVTFDAAGNQTNARLGEYSAAASARKLVLALRLNF